MKTPPHPATVVITGPYRVQIAALLARALFDHKIMTVTGSAAESGYRDLFTSKRRLTKALRPIKSTKTGLHYVSIDAAKP